MAEKDDYFRLPSLVWLILVPFGMALQSLAHLAPNLIPYRILGPLGSLTEYLVKEYPMVLMIIFYGAWIAHVYEAYLAKKISEKKNLSAEASWKWVIQTFIYGIFSLSLLKAYKPQGVRR